MSTTKPPAVKPFHRKPGRPSSKPPAPTVEKHGVSKVPMDSDNLLESAYDKPNILRALFLYFRNIKCRDIFIRCDPQQMIFFTRGLSLQSRVIAKLDGRQIN